MARRPTRKTVGKSARAAPPRATAAATPTNERDKIIAALLTLLGDNPFETIGFADVAAQAGISLAQLRGEFASTLAIVAAYIKATDRAVLAADLSDMAEEPRARTSVRCVDASARDSGAASSSGALTVAIGPPQSAARFGAQSARRALAAMDADGSRHRVFGPARHDSRPGAGDAVRISAPNLDRLMKTRARRAPWPRSTVRLARGQRFVGFLDDLCYIPSRICRLRSRRRSRYEDDSEETAAA